MNAICDGGSKQNTKGSGVMLTKNPMVYVFSNYEILDTYEDQEKAMTLKSRFNEYELVEFTHLKLI